MEPVRTHKVYKAVVEPHELDKTISMLEGRKFIILGFEHRKDAVHILYKRLTIWPLSKSY